MTVLNCPWCGHPEVEEGKPFVVSDDKNAVTGDPSSVPILGRFETEQEAAEFISTLPEPETGRYNLDGPADDLVVCVLCGPGTDHDTEHGGREK